MRRYADNEMSMSVKVVCPQCGEGSTFHRTPVALCARCQQPYPDTVRAPAERALAFAAASKPLLLIVGQFMSGLMGVTFLTLLGLAPCDVGEFSYNGRAVSGPEFLRLAGPTFAVVGGLFAAIGWGLWRNKPWARPLIMLWWFALIVLVIAVSWGTPEGRIEALGTLATLVPLAVIAWWYLYRKENVVTYFAAQARMAEFTERAA